MIIDFFLNTTSTSSKTLPKSPDAATLHGHGSDSPDGPLCNTGMTVQSLDLLLCALPANLLLLTDVLHASAEWRNSS